MIIIGSHQSLNGDKMLLGSVERAIEDGANTFMVYFTPPRTSRRRDLATFNLEEAKAKMKQNGIEAKKVVIHAPYIINIASSDPSKRKFAIDFLILETKMIEQAGFSLLVVHPGSAVGCSKTEAIENASGVIKEVIKHTNVKIAVELMAGKGGEICSNFDQLATLLDLVDSSQVGICFDTCHGHDSGYDIGLFDNIIKEIDQKLGLDKLFVIHLNDSKNERGSHKDRHENIGKGKIGLEPLKYIVHHPLCDNIPIILETPYTDTPLYKEEIALLLGDKGQK